MFWLKNLEVYNWYRYSKYHTYLIDNCVNNSIDKSKDIKHIWKRCFINSNLRYKSNQDIKWKQ